MPIKADWRNALKPLGRVLGSLTDEDWFRVTGRISGLEG